MFWITGILGLTLSLSPFVMGFAGHGIALWTSVVLGAIVVVVSLIGLASTATDKSREYWVLGLSGLAAFIASFIFGYASRAQALWAGLFLGAVLILAASIRPFLAPPEMPSRY